MPRGRYVSGTISTSAHVDIEMSDIIDDIPSDTMVEELIARGDKPPADRGSVDLAEVLGLLLRGNTQEAIVQLERIVLPKVLDVGVYEKARTMRDPITGRPILPW